MLKANIVNKVIDNFRLNPFWNDRLVTSDETHRQNIDNLLKNLDEEGRTNALNLINKLEKTFNKKMVPLNEVYTKEELDLLEKVKQFESVNKKASDSNGNVIYKWENYILPIDIYEPSVFFYNHGLDTLKNIQNIGNKTIIDVGCYIADSVLVFRKYFKNNRIIGFEPTKSNYEMALKTLELNHIENAKIENIGLGEAKYGAKINASENPLKSLENAISESGNESINITTLDDYVKENNLKVGLIKVDIEGYEPKFLEGAKKTIQEQKPTILLSIYHNYHDFYKLKPMLESFGVNYRYDFFSGIQNCGNIITETILIAEYIEG